MGESKSVRATKNSQKVASLEEQNQILEEVLKASRQQNGAKNKEKAGLENSSNSEDQTSKEDKIEKKCKANSQSEDPSPTKKPKTGVEQYHKEVVNQAPVDEPRKKLILEYPNYEENKEDDFYDGRQQQLGHSGKAAKTQRRAETSRREHEVSSEEDDDIEEFANPPDIPNDDFLGDEEGWDNRSIASSAIFPSQQRHRENGRYSSVMRPEGGRSRSNTYSQGTSSGHGGVAPTSTSQSSNVIEDLVKERAGADQGQESVGPLIAECIADLLKSYLKEPSSEAMLKLLENYPRPANAEWLQAPTVGTQVAASIPKRSNNYDKRLRQSQVILGGSLAAMASVLQDIMHRGKEDQSLLALARKAMDAMALAGYVHFDFNGIRKGAIRQVVNPNYAGVFTKKTSSTPENLLGECSVPDQLKEYEEINKVRAKLQKPRKSGSGEPRHDSGRGRGRGFNSNFVNNGNKGGFSNRGGGNHQGSGFGNYQRGDRGSRPGFPQQRRVYGHNHQNNQDQKNN